MDAINDDIVRLERMGDRRREPVRRGGNARKIGERQRRRVGAGQLRSCGRDRRNGACHLRSEEHTSELQSLMRISYAVFCLKKKKKNEQNEYKHTKTAMRSQEK